MATTETKTTPKTETPFTAPSFDPTAAWTQGQQVFTKLMTDAVARWQTFQDQYATIEQQLQAQATQNVNHLAQLAKDAIGYGMQLSAEARKLTVETAKKMGIQA